MSWLRLDDGFASHPKVAVLSDREFRTWVRVLLYCARYRTEGALDTRAAKAEIPGISSGFIDRITTIGLLDKADDGSLTVHNWANYNSRDTTAAERMRRLRERNTDRNETRNGDVTEPVTRTRARARVPVPSRPEPVISSSAVRGEAAAADGLTALAASVGWDTPKVFAARGDEERAIAWLAASMSRTDVRNPGGWAWHGFSTGEWPSDQQMPTESKGQNLAGAEADHSQVLDYCYRCQQQRTLAELDEHAGLCAGCAEQEAA